MSEEIGSNEISDDLNHKIIEQHFGIYGCGALITAVASWFVPGFPALFVGLAAVAAGFWGNRRDEKLSQTALFIGSITILFVNLVNIGIVPVSRLVPSDKTHIINSINESIQIFSIIKSGKLSEGDREKLLFHIEKAATEAKKVDLETVNKQLDGFTDHYQDKFLKGLEILKIGYKNDNFLKIFQGAALIDKWAKWNQHNRENLGKIAEPEISLFSLLFKIIAV